MSGKAAFRGFLEPLGFFLLAFTVRALPYPSLLQGREGVVFFGNDAYYHARRVWYSVIHFPSVLERDLFMNYPHGGEPIWPVTLDWLAAAGVRFFVGAEDPLAMKQILVWIPPVVGALTVVGVWWLVKRHFSRGAAAAAAGILACLPAHFWYSQVGFFDHHVVSALSTLALLAAAMELLALPSGTHAARRLPITGLVGIALGSVLLVWPGALLHVFVVEGAFVVRLLTAPSRVDAAFWGRRFGAANAVACAVVAPLSLAHSWEYWGEFSPLVLSHFQPTFFIAAAIFYGFLAEFWMRVSRPAARSSRWLQAGVLGAVMLGVLWTLFPTLFSGLADSWQWFAKTESFQAEVAESKALFSGGVERPEELLTRLLYLVPVLLVAFAIAPVRRFRRPIDFLFLGWVTILALATVVQFRFMNSFSIAFSILVAATCVPWLAMLFRERFVDPKLRAVGILVVIAVILYAVAPAARTYQPPLRNFEAWISGEKVRPVYLARLQVVREAMARWLRRNTEPTGDGFSPGSNPEYGILAPWSSGHVIKYVAKRPVLTDNFGDDVAPENMDRVQRYFDAEEESEALEILEEVPTRYVVVRNPESDRLRESGAFGMENRLFRFRGSGKWVVGKEGTPPPRKVRALERHRLVYESAPLYGKLGEEEALYRVFEIVPGAKIEGRALPGEVVTARLSITARTRSSFEYQVSTRADKSGRYSLRVPYANDRSTPGLHVADFYRVEAQSGSSRLHVPEEVVQRGGTLRVSPLRTRGD